MLTGIAASPGIAVGKVLLVSPELDRQETHSVQDDQQAAFQQALTASKNELMALRQRVSVQTGEAAAAVFDAQMLMLDDPNLVNPVCQAIDDGVDAVQAVEKITQTLTALFAGMENSYMRERAADINDISRRLIRHLTGSPQLDWTEMNDPVILVAQDLTPSDTAQLDPCKVLGFATQSGGKTSHSAILARTLEIPAVVGVPGLLAEIKGGDVIGIDGEAGEVFINPDPAVVNRLQQKAAIAARLREELTLLRDHPAITQDGHRVELAANVGHPKDIPMALAHGAEGVGLYRTEFIFMGRTQLPDEEEQYQAYRTVVAGMKGKPVIIRTLDVGGDKQIPYLNMPSEANPFLGWRALRMCLDRPELFKTQLRALWRAGCHGMLKIMFPMVSQLAEVRLAKELLAQAREELLSEGYQLPERIPVGIMIEIPAAALIADQLAREVDFFSIGSNDLIQYTIGVDRMNQQISRLYQPLHPGVLRLIAMVIEAAHRQDKWVGMCGEMAGELQCVPILLGLGLDEFSMSSGNILQVKHRIQTLSAEHCRNLAAKCLAAGEAEEVRRLVESLK